MAKLKVYDGRDLFPAPIIPPLAEYCDAFEVCATFDEADLVLLPQDEVFDEYPASSIVALGVPETEHEALRGRYRNLLQRTFSDGRPSVHVRHSDFSIGSVPDSSIILQTNGFRSQRRPREFALAGFGALEVGSEGPGSPPPEWAPRPSVGFQGSARLDGWSIERLLRDPATLLSASRNAPELVRRAAWNDGQLLRSRTLDVLQESDLVELDALRITRGYLTAGEEARRRNRSSYIKRMLDNPYSLCIRGRGNFSYRLYETMQLGRIPLFVDTDCVLPFDDEVDWPSEVVWVDEADVDRVAAILVERHPSSAADLQRWSRRIRQLWEKYCERSAYWQRIGDRLAALC